ncbi:hypothetical protein MYOV003v1_p0029 [Vibrio phage 207E48.1]|nr:hypothetical protein MYOV003v1_p0029 [Vibrio phage 207E48.1]
MNNDKFPRTRPHVNVGVIGHVGCGAAAKTRLLMAAIQASETMIVCPVTKVTETTPDSDVQTISLDSIYLLATRWRPTPAMEWVTSDDPEVGSHNPFKNKNEMRARNRRTQAAFNNIQNKKHFKGKR